MNELLEVQTEARKAGRVANLVIDEGKPLAVFYLDSKGPGRQRSGMFLDPLSFIETERAKPRWWAVDKVLTPAV